MLYYLSAAGLIAHTFFWGLGLAWLAVPREWRRWGWVFAPALGWALQSAVVWAGAHTPLAGTDAYARISELLPLALLVFAVRRGRTRLPYGWVGVLAVSLVAGWLLLSPMAAPGRGLTASSLGSCDHADYAAGARVFQEFSRDDRTGFMGLSEVTKVRSTEYFFDVWLRLNHFTPAALLAHNASAFGLEAYRLVSVTAAALVLLNLPMLLFLARVIMGLKGPWLIALMALYAISPLNTYAVHHGALGQLYAAHGIALLTLAVFGASRAAHGGRRVIPFLPLVLAAVWLLAGSYNFILLVCLAPAGAWLLAQLVWRRDLTALARVIGLLAAAGAVCVLLFWARFSGLAERFSLFEQYNFGWAVPLASPEGWLGLLRDSGLNAGPTALRMILSAGVVGLYGWGVWRWWRRQPTRAVAALALVLPVVAGWAILARETGVRSNASYDAYKILSVFYPGLLAGLLCWLAVIGPRVAAVLLTLLLAGNLVVAMDFRREMSTPPLRVDRHLAAVARLESDSRVTSVNMLLADFWSRLWANAFLLRKPQYFVTHSYEGRLNTALKGEWNLSDSLLRSQPAAVADFVNLNAQFHAVRVSAPGRVDLGFGEGWHALEGTGIDRWRWSSGLAGISVVNPSTRPVTVNLMLRVRSLARDRLQLAIEKVRVGEPRQLDGNIQLLEYESVVLPPGAFTLTLQTDLPAGQAAASDPRMLALALYELTVQAVP